MSIEDLKKRYGRVFVYRSGGAEYIYRALTVSEYRDTSMILEMEDKEKRILSYGLLAPIIAFEDLPTGVAEVVIHLISKVTNISQETLMQKVQAERDKLGMADDFLKWKIQIIKALNYTPEQVDKMDVDSFVRALVLAEEVLQVPLVAVGAEEPGPPAAPDKKLGDPNAVELEDMSQIGQVADITAQHLRDVYRRKRGARTG